MLNFRRKVKQQENERLQSLEKLNEKTKKIEDYKEQKMLFSLKKKELQEEITKQKKDILRKFEKISKNNGITVSYINNIDISSYRLKQ